MAAYISLLRGINVSGRKKIKMEYLKMLYKSLKFKDVTTYIQSGNVVFQCQDSPPLLLAKKIENKIKERLGFDVPVFILTKNELQKIIENSPFEKEDASKLYITFLSDSVYKEYLDKINTVKDKSETFFVSKKVVYLFLPNGYGRTKLSNNFFEKIFNMPGTTRNWKTVNTLLDMAKKFDRKK